MKKRSFTIEKEQREVQLHGAGLNLLHHITSEPIGCDDEAFLMLKDKINDLDLSFIFAI